MEVRRLRSPVAVSLGVLLGVGLATYARNPRALREDEQKNRIGVSQVRTEHPFAARIQLDGLPKLAEVTPTLYRGAQPSEQGFETLAKMGFAIVVDFRLTGRASERKEVTRLGMRFVEIPWLCLNPKDSDITRFLALLRENPGKKIFVHCETGDDRTGMEIAAYRMVEQGWTEQEARKEMQAFGFSYFHRRICPRLGSYETHFPQRFATSTAFRNFRVSLDPAPVPQP